MMRGNGTILALGAASVLAVASALARGLGSANEESANEESVGARHEETTGYAVWLDVVHGGRRLPHFLERIGSFENGVMADSLARMVAERGLELARADGVWEGGAYRIVATIHGFEDNSDEDFEIAGFDAEAEALAFARRLHAEVS